MKRQKSIFLNLGILALMSCSVPEVGPVGFDKEYLVSGYVYMPDSVTPLANAHVTVEDFGTMKNFVGYGETSKTHAERTDEHGYFEFSIKDGAARRIEISAYFQPQCDTADVEYLYETDRKIIWYTKKHCFENLTLYSHVMEHPKRPPYTIPSYPIIGDSVLVHINPTSILSGASYIMHISLIEDDRDTIFSMNYNGTSAEEMFYVPKTADVMKKHRIYVRENNGSVYLKVNLREK